MAAGNSGSLNNSAKDADQNFSSEPAGSPVKSCGSPPTKPPVVSPQKTHWIEIAMVDEQGNPVAGEDFQVKLPDGTVIDGSLDDKGQARVGGIDQGNCQVSFPNIDKDMWKKK